MFVYRRIKKTPKFAIQNFYNYTDLNIGSNLPQIAIERIHEIAWHAQNLESASDLIADNIEIPTLRLISEGDNQSAVELLEVALMFSIGSSNLPFASMINAIKVWLEQPLFLVRGMIERGENVINLKLSLLNREKNVIDKTWQIEIPYKENPSVSKIVDATIYPLLYYFNNISAARWEALQALHIGLEEFQLFKDDQSAINHLRLAQQQFEHALVLDPGYGLAKYNLSLLLLAMGDFEQARNYLKELSAISEDTQLRLKANYHYGVALFLISQDWAYEQAVEVFKQLLNSNDKLLALLTQSALTITYAKMAGRGSENKSSLVNQSLAEADNVLEKIESLKRKDKNLAAIRIFNETAANVFAAKGYAYIASEEFEQAIEYFKQALKLHTGNITSILGLGEAYLRMGQSDEALATFKKAATQSPMSGYINYRLGNLYRELGEHDEAINVLKRASQHAHARLTLGKIYLEDEEFEKALDEFRQAVHINSHLSEGWVNIAWTILQMENKDLLKEAVKAARHSLQLEKNEKQKWHRHAILAFGLIKTDKASQAALEAMKAVELAPNQPQAHYYLALAQNKLGQNAKARDSLQRAMELDRKGFWVSSAVDLLNELDKDVAPR